MKIGMFTDSFRPYTSGVVRSIETTAAKLAEMGHEVYIFAPSYPRCKREARVFRFVSIPTPTLPEFTIALPFSLNLRSTIKRLGLDIIHVHSLFSLGSLGARYARRYGLPLVFTYHTMYDQYVHYMPFAQDISKRVILNHARKFCNRCDLVIAPTEIVRGIISKNFKAPVAVIPTGIEIEEFECADKEWLRQKYGIANECKILLHLGRLGKEKNVGFLLETYKSVQAQYENTRLIIVGDGTERQHLEEEAKQLGLGQTVLFTGPLSRKNVINSYAGADLFVFASTTETQGLVLGEAKAAGLPSVAVNALGASEMVSDGVDGFLTPLSEEIFVEKILHLLRDNELRCAMSKNAIQEAEQISAANMAKKLADAYSDLYREKNELFTLSK